MRPYLLSSMAACECPALVCSTLWVDEFSIRIHGIELNNVSHLPSRDMPVPAMLAGRGLRGAVAGRRATGLAVDNVVDVDIALPGREPLR